MLGMRVMQQREGKWLDDAGEPINVDRAMAAGAREDARRSTMERFLRIAAGEEGQARSWFVLRVDSAELKDVDNFLSRHGIGTFLPMRKIQVLITRTRRRKRNVERPVWPGLLFVQVAPCNEAWVGLSMVKGARTVLKAPTADKPTPLRDKEIAEVEGLVKAGKFDQKKAAPNLQIGDTVMIKAGRFAQMEGVLEGYVKTRAARVLAHIFGGVVPIEVDLAKIVKAD